MLAEHAGQVTSRTQDEDVLGGEMNVGSLEPKKGLWPLVD